jgi:phenylpropionate dioxygenase-like ring-hydroxylating dioxygenase large terminal subunit
MTEVVPPPRVAAGPPIEQTVPLPDARRYPFDIPFGWFQVAWSDDLAPGQVVPRFYFGRHLVLWRDEHGRAHLNDAFCPHLGGHFGYGGKVVQGDQLQCPFHGWEFDAAGANTCIPYSDRVNQKARIRSYPVRELADHFVVAWYHPDDAEPLYEIDAPPEATDSEYGEWMGQHFSVAAAAQELAENSVDGPHFRYVHNTETVPEIQSYETDGYVSRMRSVQRFPTPRGVVDGRIDVDNHGPGFSATRFSGIVDTFLIGAAVPVDANTCEVRFSFRTRRLGDAETTSTVGKAFVREVCKQFEEDRPIWEHKAHLRRPALADTDPPFMKFRKWYAQFYASATGGEHDVWAPARPDVSDGQPEFVPNGPTASQRYGS